MAEIDSMGTHRTSQHLRAAREEGRVGATKAEAEPRRQAVVMAAMARMMIVGGGVWPGLCLCVWGVSIDRGPVMIESSRMCACECDPCPC